MNMPTTAPHHHHHHEQTTTLERPVKSDDVNMIPFNMNRNVLLAFYLVIGALSGSFFFNWSPAHTMYMKNDVYVWLCDANDDSSISSSSNDDYCLKRFQAVNSMMPAGVASTFAFSLIGGLAVTSIGPKLTACMGILFQLCGWVVLYLCSEQLPAYLLSVVLMGFGSDPTLFALLNISSLFPDYRIVVIAAVFGFRSVGNVIPSIFNFVVDGGVSFQTAILCYISILALCLIFVCLLVPWSQFVLLTPDDDDITSDDVTRQPATDLEMDQSIEKQYAASVASLPTAGSFQQLEKTTYKLSKGFRESRALPKAYGFHSFESTAAYTSSDLSEGAAPAVAESSSSSSSSLNTRVVTSPQDGVSPSSSSSSSSGGTLFQLYIPLFPIAAITILTHTYFSNSSHEQLESAVLLSTIITPLAFIPAICFGFFAARYGVRWTMLLVNMISTAQILCLLGSEYSEILSWFSATLSAVVGSFFIAQFFCFIATNFEEKYFGMLAGVLTMSSGMISIIVTPMCDFSSFQQNFLAMNLLCFCATLLNFVFIALTPKAQQWLLP